MQIKHWSRIVPYITKYLFLERPVLTDLHKYFTHGIRPLQQNYLIGQIQTPRRWVGVPQLALGYDRSITSFGIGVGKTSELSELSRWFCVPRIFFDVAVLAVNQ
jgi:hypothetical protein